MEQLTPEEVRVVACLVEKELAAPDLPATPRQGERISALEARVEVLEGLVAELREAVGLGDY